MKFLKTFEGKKPNHIDIGDYVKIIRNNNEKVIDNNFYKVMLINRTFIPYSCYLITYDDLQIQRGDKTVSPWFDLNNVRKLYPSEIPKLELLLKAKKYNII
jgi:hypothetical protein